VSDIENLVDCKPASVMRIASISKPLTMVAIAQLWEQGKLDLDKPVQHYVPSWPDKVFKGQKVLHCIAKIAHLIGDKLRAVSDLNFYIFVLTCKSAHNIQYVPVFLFNQPFFPFSISLAIFLL